jgi:acyl dehydratase
MTTQDCADAVTGDLAAEPKRPQRPAQRTDIFLEDLSAGQIFGSATYQIGVAEIKRFAGEFDPQPFHLDEAEAARSLFSGLAASGWHTAAITMRLLVGSVRISGGIVGAGMDVLRWPKPVRPGDTLRLECEVLEVRPSTSHPDRGLAKVRTTTLNQHGETVQVLVANLVVPRRPRDEAGACALAPAHPRSQ